MSSPISPEPHSCAKCSSSKLLFSFHGDAMNRTVMDTEVYMFDLLYNEAVALAEDSSTDKSDGCLFMRWLIAKLPPVRDAPGQGQLQALVGENGAVKTYLYLQWVDGRYLPWLWSFRSVDGLYRPSGQAGERKPTGKKKTDEVQRKLPGLTRFLPIQIEDEMEVVGVLEKDWQEKFEEKGYYELADVPVDDSGDELQDEVGESSNVMVEGTNSIKVVLCASQDDPAAREVFTRPPNLHPSSESSLELIEKWFNECPRHSFSHQPHPKRLLRISGDGPVPSLKLVDFSADLSSAISLPRYVALSYCWGRGQTNVLRNENLFEWLTDIPHAQLPQTIKDAIYITRLLDFSYLWVDAFCIIQNDMHDKWEEIEKMGGIYENAEVTISASRASTCHDGFLHSRQKPEEQSFQIPFRCRAGQKGTVLLWHNRSEQWDEPIDRRGWTLQESLISSRILEFGTNQTRWHCNCHRYGVPHGSSKHVHLVDGWTRDKLERSPVSIDWAPVVELEEVDRFRARVPTQTLRRLEERVMQTWKRLIRNYTRRAVSDPMDRLPALSAIAQRLKGLSTQRYAGGLWLGDVPQLLFWYPVEIESMKRSPERAAPSWSWASVIGAIDFMDIGKTDISVLRVTQHELIMWGMVCRATIYRVGSDPRGSFYTGTLEYEDRYSVEGVTTMEVPSLVSKKGGHSENMYLLEFDRHGGTGLVLRKVTEGVYCRAGRYSAMRRKGATLQPYASSWDKTWTPRRYYTRSRLTLV